MTDAQIIKLILVILLPPIAILRHTRRMGFWFWVDVVLWLPTVHFGSMVIAACVVYGMDEAPKKLTQPNGEG